MRRFVRSYWTPAGRRALANLGGLVGCQLVTQGCLFGLLLAFTAGLGPAKFAAVATVQAVQAVLLVAAAAGLPAVLVRELAANPARRDELVSGYVTATAVGGLLAAVGMGFAATVLPLPADERWLWVFAAVGTLFAVVSPLPAFDADHRQAAAAFRQLPADMFALLAGLLLWNADAMTLPAAGLVLGGRLAGQWLLTAGGLGRVRLAWEPAKELWRAGGPLAAAGLLYLVPAAGGVLVLRLRAGDEPAAVYGLANQLAAVLVLAFGPFARVVQPHIHGPFGPDRAFVRKLTAAAAGVLGGLLLAGVAAGWVVFERVVPPAYRPGLGVYLVLLAGNAVYAVAVLASLYLVRRGRPGRVAGGHAAAAGLAAVGFWAVPPTPPAVAGVVAAAHAVYLAACLIPLTHAPRPDAPTA